MIPDNNNAAEDFADLIVWSGRTHINAGSVAPALPCASYLFFDAGGRVRTERPRETSGPSPRVWQVVAVLGALTVMSALGNLIGALMTGDHPTVRISFFIALAGLGVAALIISAALRRRQRP